jgi:ribonuclease-3
MLNNKRKTELDELLGSINLTVDNYELLDLALTHSSYTFENKLSSLENNERLEFLGDAVLKLIVSDYLLDRFPEYNEGELTKIRSILVSDKILAKTAKMINLGKYIKMGYHEEKQGGRKRSSTMACAFEALLGALYLDGKMYDLQMFLIEQFDEEITMIDESETKYNYKAILQEYTQAEGLELPEYVIIKENGPSHSKTFEIEVKINDISYKPETGKSKKEAQQKAAHRALLHLGLVEEKISGYD